MSNQVIEPKDLGLSQAPQNDVSVGVATWTRVLRQNWRQGTVGHKGRSDVAFSGKKPWKQKGTGRARAGMASSPLWRKGGVIFGPMPRVRKLRISQKSKKMVLSSVLWDLLNQKKLLSLNWVLVGDKPKTSYAVDLLRDAQLLGKKVCLVLEPGSFIQQASFSNVAGVKMVLFDQINVVDLIAADCVVVFNQELDRLKEVVSQWI